MLLGHYVRAESRFFEQVDQLGGIVDVQCVVVDGAGQNLCRSVEILRGRSGEMPQFAFHRRIARDDRLPRFVIGVLDLGQPAFGRPHQRGGRGGAMLGPTTRRRRATIAPAKIIASNATVLAMR
jgi:hypothetical protein